MRTIAVYYNYQIVYKHLRYDNDIFQGMSHVGSAILQPTGWVSMQGTYPQDQYRNWAVFSYQGYSWGFALLYTY